MCRELICLIVSVFVLLLSGTASADLVGHWKLDEGSGTTIADSSGNGNDGTIVNNPTWIPGRSGMALEFHGLGAPGGGGDYIECEHSDSLDITSNISIALWIRPGAEDPEGQGTETAPMAKAMSGMSPSWSFQVRYGWGGAPSPNMAFTFNTSPRAWAFVGRKLERDEWVHIACSYDGTTLKCFVNGEETDSTPMGQITSSPTPVLIGTDGWGCDWIGAIDDVRMYDHALSVPEIVATMEGKVQPQAWGPSPADGETYTETWATMSWKPGPFAVSHDVYIGDNFDDVNDGAAHTYVGNQAEAKLIVGFPGYPVPDGLVPGTTYYWRIDEVNDADPNSPWKGDIWSFWIPPKIAYEPNPVDGAMFEQTGTTVTWTPGFGTRLNHIYFGQDAAEVEAGAPTTYKGPSVNATFDPGPLEKETVYYWKVDEFDGVETHAGDVWSFRTVPVIAVGDPSLVGWWRLDEWAGGTAVDYSGGDNHGTITGDPQWVDGYAGGALEFDGNEDLVETAYPGVTGTDSRTVSAWIRTETTGEIASWGTNSTGQKWIFRVQASNGINGAIRIEVNGGYQVGMTDLRDGQWHHVAGVLTDDGTPDVTEISLYVDGEQELISANQSTAIDTAASGNVRIGEAPWHNRPFTGLIDDVRIYNKALTQDEIKQVMRVDPLLAWNRSPADRATVYINDALPLSWTPGDRASQHEVYFGTDIDAVADADTSDTSGVYRGSQSATTYTPPEGVEWGGGPYYWRVDENNNDGTVTTGSVWSFTVADYIVVDDFESYNDIEPPDEKSNRIFDNWIDGFGTTTNGALVGNDLPPYAGQSVVHSGRQAMPYAYDNGMKTSEATLTLSSPRDWTEHGVEQLSIWFRGDGANAAERMYVALNGNAVVYHDDPAATQIASWTEWSIDLARFADQGVNLANVNTVSIGFGTKNAPAAGGTGLVHFDDIRLYR
jgi:hypothetical protein